MTDRLADTPAAAETFDWLLDLGINASADPLERILAVLRVRAPKYLSLEYTTSSRTHPGSLSLRLVASTETIRRLRRYLERVIGVSEITVTRLDGGRSS